MAKRPAGVLDAAALHDLVNPEKPKKAKKKKKKARVEIEDEDEPAAPLKAKTKKSKKSKKARVVEEAAAPPAAPVYPNGRRYTVSIALPGSIIANSQTVELQTYLAGQIARALTVFEIDEIVIFDDQSASGQEARGGPPPKRVAGRDRNFNPNVFLAHVLQYLETPQYLRRALFPMHDDLRLAGVLNPLDAPHHMRASERTRFREGVVTEVLDASCSVNVGLRRDIEVAQRIPRNTRITVEVDPSVYDSMHKRVSPGASLGVQGTAVAPTAPREQDGTYWGYSTRFAASFSKVWSECMYEGGYSLSIGTSERNSESIIDPSFALPELKHLLIVIGGVEGLEFAVDLDGDLEIGGDSTSALFDKYINIAPTQGSRTIRTEEALLITMALLQPHIGNANTGGANGASNAELGLR